MGTKIPLFSSIVGNFFRIHAISDAKDGKSVISICDEPLGRNGRGVINKLTFTRKLILLTKITNNCILQLKCQQVCKIRLRLQIFATNYRKIPILGGIWSFLG